MGDRFFCENCGAEVKRDSKTCPQCGLSFADVLCLSCGFSGEPRLFTAGCPVCGAPASPAPAGKAPKPGRRSAPRQRPAAAPPVWSYLLAILVFAAIAALLLTK
jgi:RNA polymerase subunit RPABC4/transcription elongation factor Spt4